MLVDFLVRLLGALSNVAEALFWICIGLILFCLMGMLLVIVGSALLAML